MFRKDEITHLSTLDIATQLKKMADTYVNQVKFSTSFGLEDQLITHYIFQNNINIEVFTIDTGRLFQETYAVWNATLAKYNKPIKAFFPNDVAVEDMITQQGPNAFYESIEKRKQCCAIRKVHPLNRALQNTKIWITGLRQEQSDNRMNVQFLTYDSRIDLWKMQPLWNFSFEEVKKQIAQYAIPYHPLHDKGFPSIGCLPCTRAIKQGENFRAGRWWWENNNNKECGLHQQD